jgi:hypothetical protein
MEKLEGMLTKESNDIKKAASSAAATAGMMNMERSLKDMMAPVKKVVGSVQKEFAKGGEHLGLIVLGVVALAGFLSSAFPKFEATMLRT